MSRVVVVVGYVSSLIRSVAREPVAVILVSAMMIVTASWDLRVAVGPSRQIELIVLRAAVWLGVTLSGTALALLMVPDTEAGRPVRWCTTRLSLGWLSACWGAALRKLGAHACH